MKRSLVVGVVLFCAVALLAKVLVDRFTARQWRELQQRYNELQRARGLRPIAVEVRELTPLGGGVSERCVSCHLGMLLADPHRPPFQAHPELPCPLPVAKMGCVRCHGGAGQALTVEAAHGSPAAVDQVRDWRGGARRKVLLQSGCAGCHRSRDGGILSYPRRIVPDVAAGLDHFLGQGCYACHRVAGVYHFSDAGPELTRIGRRLSSQAIRRHLLAPQERTPSSSMPPLAGPTDREVDQLVLFLAAQVGLDQEPGSSPRARLAALRSPRLSDHFVTGYPVHKNPAAGAWWARKVGCLGCHRLGEEDSGVPDLGLVGWTTSEQELLTTLLRPRRRFPGSWMPGLELPQGVVESMVAFLARQQRPLPSAADAVSSAVCGRCHNSDRDSRWVVLNKRPPLFTGPQRRLPEEAAFVAAASSGRQGTAMAPWGKVLARPFLRALHRHLAQSGGRR